MAFVRSSALRSLAMLACSGLVLIGCGSGDTEPQQTTDDTEAPATATATEQEEPDSDGSEAADDGIEEAEEIAADLRERPTSIGIDEPITGEIPEGLEVYFIQCGLPVCVEWGNYFEAATDALGWNLTRVNGGLAPEEVKGAWAQAARAAPDAVVGTGFPRSIFEEEIQQLEDAGAAVVLASVAEEAGDGILAVIAGADRYRQLGRYMAAYVLADTGRQTNAVHTYSQAFPVSVAEYEGFEEEFGRLCPECPLEEHIVPAESIGADLPTRVVSYLQSHTDVNYAVISFSDMMIGVPGAVADAGLDDRVKLLTQDINPIVIAQHVVDGDVEATFGTPGQDVMWRIADVLARHAVGQALEPNLDAPFPFWAVTADTVPSTSETFPVVEDYQEQFKSLWGVE